MVLHDQPTGAINHPNDPLRTPRRGSRRALSSGFPPACVPIRSGEIVLPTHAYVSNVEESVTP
jgi:hypothetical protein